MLQSSSTLDAPATDRCSLPMSPSASTRQLIWSSSRSGRPGAAIASAFSGIETSGIGCPGADGRVMPPGSVTPGSEGTVMPPGSVSRPGVRGVRGVRGVGGFGRAARARRHRRHRTRRSRGRATRDGEGGEESLHESSLSGVSRRRNGSARRQLEHLAEQLERALPRLQGVLRRVHLGARIVEEGVVGTSWTCTWRPCRARGASTSSSRAMSGVKNPSSPAYSPTTLASRRDQSGCADSHGINP